MEEILQKQSFWNSDCFTENAHRNFRRGLKKLLKRKRRKNIFCSNRVCLLKTFH